MESSAGREVDDVRGQVRDVFFVNLDCAVANIRLEVLVVVEDA